MANKKQEVGTSTHNDYRPVKCWNSVSCIISAAIIVFTLGSVLYDLVITKPEIKESITKIEYNIERINMRLNSDSLIYNNVMSFEEFQKKDENK